MSDEKFWLGVCTIFAVITLGTVSLVTGGCYQEHRNYFKRRKLSSPKGY